MIKLINFTKEVNTKKIKNNMAKTKTALYQKRRKDRKIQNSDGISRVKPIKNVGTDPDTGKKIQNVVVKRADGATITTRYADGEKVGETYQPKKMKMKKVKKIRGGKRLPRKLKKVKMPEYTAPEVSLDEDALAEVKKREEVKKKKEEIKKRTEEKNKPKNKIKRSVRRTKKKVSDAIKTTKNKVKKVFTKRPKSRRVKNLVTGGYNKLR